MPDIASAEVLATLIIATGALGTSAFGVVEGLKWTRLGAFGFETLQALLGAELMRALEHAYGERCRTLLEAQYRAGRGKGELRRTLRQGIRIGLPGADTERLAGELPGVNARSLKSAANAVGAGRAPTEAQRRALGRFELAVDARIDAALAVAESRYVAAARILASAIALGVALAVGVTVGASTPALGLGPTLGLALIVGLAAIPVAPVAKDLASAVRSADRALRVVR